MTTRGLRGRRDARSSPAGRQRASDAGAIAATRRPLPRCSSWKPGPSRGSSAMSIPAAMTTWTPTPSAPAPRPSGPTSRPWPKPAPQGCGMGRLRIIGLEAEAAMLAATGGRQHPSRRHIRPGPALRGRRRQGRRTDRSRDCRWAPSSRALWGASILDGPRAAAQPWRRGPPPLWRRRRAAGGRPAAFPASIGSACPPCAGMRSPRPSDAEAARVEACFALIASVEDTNLLHRGGLERSSLRASRGARFLDEAAWASPAGASARMRCMRASSPAGSARAARPTFLP